MALTSNSIFTNFITLRQIMARDNSSSVTFASEVAMSENRITGLGDPTVSTDAATKGYVDNIRPKNLKVAGTALAISSTATDITLTSTALPTKGGTMTGNLIANATSTIGTPSAPWISSEISTANTKKLVIFNAGRSKYNSITSSATTSHNYTLPYEQGAENTFLRNDGIGLLSWATATPSLSQLYAACECTATDGFDALPKQINKFMKIGDANALGVSNAGITISMIGMHDIFFSAQVCLIHKVATFEFDIKQDATFEFDIKRGEKLIKSFVSSFSANGPNGQSMSPSYRIFYNKIAPGEELINVYHSTKQPRFDNHHTTIILNCSYLSVSSIK